MGSICLRQFTWTGTYHSHRTGKGVNGSFIVLLGTLGIASIGTLFSAIAAATQAREMLLPILVFPLIIPVVIGAVRATGTLMVPSINEPPWLGLMLAFDVIFLSVSMLMFEYVIEE